MGARWGVRTKRVRPCRTSTHLQPLWQRRLGSIPNNALSCHNLLASHTRGQFQPCGVGALCRRGQRCSHPRRPGLREGPGLTAHRGLSDNSECSRVDAETAAALSSTLGSRLPSLSPTEQAPCKGFLLRPPGPLWIPH